VTTLKMYLVFAWGTIALFALCVGVARWSAAAFSLFLTLVLPFIVFVWWSVDRAALERRIKRLEARSEIADDRRVNMQTGLTEVGRQLNAIEARVTDVESVDVGS
jgi:hypothetical protein